MTETAKAGRVRMVGGVILAANDPKSLAKWYADTLGLKTNPVPEHDVYALEFHYIDAEDNSKKSYIFGLKQASPKLSGERRGCTVNLRVDDLDAVLAKVKAAGVAVEKTEKYSYGRFAWIKDAEGNPLELWQASTAPASRTPEPKTQPAK